MSGRIRYHINTTNGKAGVKPKKRIQSDAEKIFVLVNDALSGEPTVTDFSMSQVWRWQWLKWELPTPAVLSPISMATIYSLKVFLECSLKWLISQDINAICTTGTRICRCMSDYFIFMKRFTETRNALLLSKCLKQRLWENTKFQLKQLVGVGLVTAKVIKLNLCGRRI